MNFTKFVILVCFVVLLGVPVVFRPASTGDRTARGAGLSLIIITPHNEQIRYEFARGFDAWHRDKYGEQVNVIYNVPGGTSEIRKMLESQFSAAIDAGRPPGGDADLVFGGGTFEHGRLKRGIRVVRNGIESHEPISAPVEFSDEWLNQIYGENRIGDDPLYDPERHWFGLALSGFGIVFNRDLLHSIGIAEPFTWEHLCHAKLQGWIALVNPNQSGSVTTAFESIFKQTGWKEGWRILRRAGANARYFSASALKPPIDVSQGNAAMGVCIDFFGRYQSQALKEAGDPDRIGYVDPPGGTLDADPISMLRNAPHPELAQRFIEFCLSDHGQSLWQFARREQTPGAHAQLGPERFELRRMPIIRSMYDHEQARFVDKINPFELARPAAYPDPNIRDFIAPLFSAMVMDNHHELKEAWRAIAAHPEVLANALVDAESAQDPALRQMLQLFDAMPAIEGPNDARWSLERLEHRTEVRTGWLRGGWAKERLWHPEASPTDEMRKRFGVFFRDNYRRIGPLAEGK